VERYEEVLKAIFFVKLLQIADLLGLADNGRRYVQLPQHRSGMCFCRLAWRDESFSIFLLVIRGKNHDTRRESPAGAGAACAALVMNFGSYLNHLLFLGLLTCFLQLNSKRGTEGNCIYRPVSSSNLFS